MRHSMGQEISKYYEKQPFDEAKIKRSPTRLKKKEKRKE